MIESCRFFKLTSPHSFVFQHFAQVNSPLIILKTISFRQQTNFVLNGLVYVVERKILLLEIQHFMLYKYMFKWIKSWQKGFTAPAQGYWKGLAAVKKLSAAANGAEDTTKKWLFWQAVWQFYLPTQRHIPCPRFTSSPGGRSFSSAQQASTQMQNLRVRADRRRCSQPLQRC